MPPMARNIRKLYHAGYNLSSLTTKDVKYPKGDTWL